MKVFAVYGFKGSGKTTVVSKVIRELGKRGYRVCAFKNTHISGFSIDERNKDTWVFSRHGAVAVGIRADSETSFIFKKKFSLNEIISFLDCDYLVLEGFRDEIVPKILCAKDVEELTKSFHELVFAVSGAVSNTIENYKGVPVINALKETDRLVDLIEKKVFPKIPELNCGKCGFGNCRNFAVAVLKGETSFEKCVASSSNVRIKINGRDIPLSPFPERVVRNVILGVVSSLKGYRERGKVEIKLEN